MSQECLYCKKKIPMTKVFCSKPCKDDYFDLIAIQVPKTFLRRIYLLCSEEEKDQEILNFSKRHKWRLDLLKTKIEDESIKMGYAV